ncbi:MAG: tetratricopeptide repeat protein [Pseudomonadota bacterium]
MSMDLKVCGGFLLLLLAGGCSWFGGSDEYDRKAPRLAELLDDLPPLELPSGTAPPPTTEDALAAYEQVYGVLTDGEENFAVGRRLADLRMQRGEQLDIDGEANAYDDAVTLYEELLLESTVDSAERDQILYQLARAHDVQGNAEATQAYLDQLIAEHPDSIYLTEAHFRRAELAFSQERYDAAARDFAVVVEAGQDSPLWQNANYMRGWSLFKRSELEAGLLSFYSVLDTLIGAAAGAVEGAPLTSADKELLDDSLRVTTLALGYLDGPATLALQMRDIGRPSWQYLVYERLAVEYADDERFLDSVATWQVFVDENPLDIRAPNAHRGMIDTLLAADFPSEVEPRKRDFVERYGVRSEFWQVHQPQQRADDTDSYLPTLKTYLDELAAVSHADAQALKDGTRRRADAFRVAADWYEQIIETFPTDPTVAEKLFLLGEVYTEAGDAAPAVAAYQRVLRDFPEHERANEAGYAAILGLTELTAATPAGDEQQRWQQQKIDAQVEFALLFPNDERAPAVQVDAANALFTLTRYEQAVELAQRAAGSWPEMAPALAATNLLVLGHGNFALELFATAEQAFGRYLALPVAVADEAERKAVAEKQLAAVYKQGERAEADGSASEAVGHYLRIKTLAPGAELAVQGHFDAVAVLETAGQVAEAADLLDQFRGDYPDHPLAADVDLRLAGMHEKTERLDLAAIEYTTVSRRVADPEVARQALYRAGEIWLELGAAVEAERSLNEYVERFPEPLTAQLEVVAQLDDMAVARGDRTLHRRWLDRKITIFRKMGSKATSRAADLAVRAEFELAGAPKAEFLGIELTRPLKRSLKRKQQALAKAVKAFEAVAAYKVPEFASASAFEIAELYVALASSIMASERPGNLSALELEQYDLLLEEQAYPFEEQAIDLHEINMRRSWDGIYDQWVQQSFEALRRLMPARFDKQELVATYVESIH